MRQILHIDINSFFASCEQAVDETIRGKPIAVVSSLEGRNCILLAVSYEAKAYGIKRTMSLKHAQSLCQDLVLRVANHTMYQDFSDKFIKVLCEYAPIVENTSIDEAYLDMTGTERLYGDIKEFAKKIQNMIYDKLLLPSSIGIADNKCLAKMASDYKKPLGITEFYSANIKKQVWPLSVDTLWGVGSKTLGNLQKLGIYTIGDLAIFDKAQLKIYIGESSSEMLHKYANGIDNSKVISYDKNNAKSIGKEITFEEDITSRDIIKKELLLMSEKVATRLRKVGKKAKTVTLKIKYNNFTVITRSHTLEHGFNTTNSIYKTAVDLYIKQCINSMPIRLVGVQVSNIEKNDKEQMSLFTNIDDDKDERFEKSIDIIRQKYGYNIIKRNI
ncbi:MAG TPA: DNA polymerase IV [Clostridiales bacterium]|nr:MAG: hypothetical protein A2Y18_06015 [Clostridiales bacterium GWD2_32_19]HCC08275.1 DNA polymerase IV [Clostridiales bacterium]